MNYLSVLIPHSCCADQIFHLQTHCALIHKTISNSGATVVKCTVLPECKRALSEHALSAQGSHTGTLGGRRYLHARAQSLQVSKVQALPAGVQTLHHTVGLHAARTHRHAGQQAMVAAHVLRCRPETVAASAPTLPYTLNVQA